MSLRLSKAALATAPSATLRINAVAGQLKNKGINIISLCAGEPDFDTPAHICRACAQAMQSGYTRYTDVSGMLPLRQAVCDHIQKHKGLLYVPDEIIIGSGAKQVLFTALQALIDPGDEVLLPAPYWVSYPDMIRIAGGTPCFINTSPDQGFLPSCDQLAQAVTPRTKAIIINTPGNPSGAVWPQSLLQSIMQLAQKHNLFVISDEIYESLLYDHYSHLSPATVSNDARSRTLVVSGMSKTYAMTGWRIGYGAGPKALISAMAALQSHTAGNACTLSQHAALAALSEPQDCVEHMKQAFARRRKLLLDCLQSEGLQPAIIPHGAFYLLLDVRPFLSDTRPDDESFCEQLLNTAHVALTPGTPFGACGFVRLSFATGDHDITQAVHRIGEFVRNLK